MAQRYHAYTNSSLGQVRRSLKSTDIAKKGLETAINFRVSSLGGTTYRPGFRINMKALGNSRLMNYGAYTAEIAVGQIRMLFKGEPVTTATIEIFNISGSTIAFLEIHGLVVGDQIYIKEYERDDRTDILQVYTVVTVVSTTTVVVDGLPPDANFADKVQIFTNSYDAIQIKALHYATLGTGIYLCVSRRDDATPTGTTLLGFTNNIWSYNETPTFTSATFTNPNSCFVFESRLCFLEGSMLHMSRIGTPTNFTVANNPQSAIKINLFNRGIDHLLWGQGSDRTLIIGTPSSILEIYGTTTASAISATNITIREASRAGTSFTQAIKGGEKVLYEKSTSCGVMSLFFNGEQSQISIMDSGAVSDVPNTPMFDLAYSRDKTDRLIASTADGRLIEAMFSIDEQNPFPSWSEISGPLHFGSVSSLPVTGKPDAILVVASYKDNYFLIEQSPPPAFPNKDDYYGIDGEISPRYYEDRAHVFQESNFLDFTFIYNGYKITKTAITEVSTSLVRTADPFFRVDDVGEDIYIEDSVLTIQTVVSETEVAVTPRKTGERELLPTAAFTWGIATNNLKHLLPSITVYVRANGNLLGDITTDVDGTITLDDSYIYIQAGLQYVGMTRNMPNDFGEGIDVDGMKMQGNNIQVRVLNSYSFKIGRSLDSMYSWDATNPVNQLASEQGGHVNVPVSGETGQDDQIYIVQDKPQPVTILSIGFLITMNT